MVWEKFTSTFARRILFAGSFHLLGNGVGEGEKGPAHAVGELVKQDPGIVRVQAITGVIQFWRRGLFVCTDCDLLVLIMT